MKKTVLVLGLAVSLIACKKSEITEAQNAIDSIRTVAQDHMDAAQAVAENALDSSDIKIKEIESIKYETQKKFEDSKKSIDSLTEKISNVKLESKPEKKDSIKQEKPQVVVNVPAPKVIKETKVIYKTPEQKPVKLAPEALVVKKASLQLNVDRIQKAKEDLFDEVYKYDGSVKSENQNAYKDEEYATYVVNVPISKFDYFIEGISNNVGEIVSKNSETTGSRYNENSMARVEIALYKSGQNAVAGLGKSDSFGDQFFSAIASGWDVIKNIFLFLLPFWPLYLIIGIGYYFYKKRNPKQANS